MRVISAIVIFIASVIATTSAFAVDLPARKPRRIAELEGEIIGMCRQSLAPHKVPAAVRIVGALDMTAVGKLAREAR